jgi:hypothetical protein
MNTAKSGTVSTPEILLMGHEPFIACVRKQETIRVSQRGGGEALCNLATAVAAMDPSHVRQLFRFHLPIRKPIQHWVFPTLRAREDSNHRLSVP